MKEVLLLVAPSGDSTRLPTENARPQRRTNQPNDQAGIALAAFSIAASVFCKSSSESTNEM